MPTSISSPRAVEKSTVAVTAAFTDEAGADVTPNALTWTLSTDDGTVINERDSVVITPDSTVTIVLSGDDLEVFADDSGIRVLTVEGTYDSSLGSDLPLKDELHFAVDDLVNVD